MYVYKRALCRQSFVLNIKYSLSSSLSSYPNLHMYSACPPYCPPTTPHPPIPMSHHILPFRNVRPPIHIYCLPTTSSHFHILPPPSITHYHSSNLFKLYAYAMGETNVKPSHRPAPPLLKQPASPASAGYAEAREPAHGSCPSPCPWHPSGLRWGQCHQSSA